MRYAIPTLALTFLLLILACGNDDAISSQPEPSATASPPNTATQSVEPGPTATQARPTSLPPQEQAAAVWRLLGLDPIRAVPTSTGVGGNLSEDELAAVWTEYFSRGTMVSLARTQRLFNFCGDFRGFTLNTDQGIEFGWKVDVISGQAKDVVKITASQLPENLVPEGIVGVYNQAPVSFDMAAEGNLLEVLRNRGVPGVEVGDTVFVSAISECIHN